MMNSITTTGDIEEAETLPTAAVAAPEMAAPVFGRRNLLIAGALFCFALLSLLGLQHEFHIDPFSVSVDPHFVYQADAFLHGRWNLSLTPKTNDIVTINGKYYTIFPPFPALLLLPFVAIFGTNTSDVFFTAVCSAIVLALLFLLFEQVRANGLTRRSWKENALIALLCYFGSLTLYLSLGGELWFTAHIVAVMMTLISLILLFRRHYVWSTIALGCAFFSRGTLLIGFPFLFYMAWQDSGNDPLLKRFALSLWARRPDWSAVPWRRLLPPLAVMVVIGILYLVHNTVLFGSPLESGYGIIIHQRYPEVTHGVFNIRYVPRNVIADFFTFPRVIFSAGPYDLRPAIDMINGGNGTSVFFTTPLFLLLFWRNRTFSWLRAALWVTVGLDVLQIMLFHWTGWYQFGARYLFEAYPYAFLLLVLNEVRVDWRFLALGALGVVINILGARQFWTNIIFHL